MHEWRKRSKDLYYQLRSLKPISPGIVGGAAKDAHRLTDLLGDVHDLALLDHALRQISGAAPADPGPMRAAIEDRRHHLTAESFTVGERLYAESPKKFIQRMHTYWHAWRVEFVETPGARPPFAAAF
jgi:CHAD domain-containing protein